jgi:long-chain acyl-CoA synthetase
MDRFWTQHYESGVPADLAFEEVTVLDLFNRTATTWGDRPAVTLKGKTLSYRQLKDQVDRFATALARLGVKKDTRVALWLPNLPQMVIAYFATLKLGALVVNTNPLYVERELEHQFNDAGVTVVVTLDYLWWYKLRGMLAKTQVKQVIVTSIPDYLPFPLNLLAPLKLKKTKQYVKVPKEAGVYFFRDLIAQTPPAPPEVAVTLEDLAVLQYTGGTTGVSKGAMLTHRNLSANVQQSASWFPTIHQGEEVLLACLPYFHVFGMTISMLWPVAIGAHIVLAPNPRDIPDLVKSIQRHRVSIFPAVPALFVAINNYPGVDRIDLSSVRACFSGSAPLPVEVMERFEKLTGGKITEGFGMTETSPVTHANPLLGLRKPGSVGIPLPGTDAKVVDAETGTVELGLGHEGELCLRGPQVMAGYWNRPDETAKAMPDGWMHTGDLARVDEDGYTFIVGRKKDMILAGGYNVYPDEVDGVIFGHPAVLESATIGVPDERCGERIKAFVVLKPGQSLSEEALKAYLAGQLAKYKLPRDIEFLAELPKSSMMKILRRELRDRELERIKKVMSGG